MSDSRLNQFPVSHERFIGCFDLALWQELHQSDAEVCTNEYKGNGASIDGQRGEVDVVPGEYLERQLQAVHTEEEPRIWPRKGSAGVYRAEH